MVPLDDRFQRGSLYTCRWDTGIMIKKWPRGSSLQIKKKYFQSSIFHWNFRFLMAKIQPCVKHCHAFSQICFPFPFFLKQFLFLILYSTLRRSLHANWFGHRWSSEPLAKAKGRRSRQNQTGGQKLIPPDFQERPLNAGTLTWGTGAPPVSQTLYVIGARVVQWTTTKS